MGQKKRARGVSRAARRGRSANHRPGAIIPQEIIATDRGPQSRSGFGSRWRSARSRLRCLAIAVRSSGTRTSKLRPAGLGRESSRPGKASTGRGSGTSIERSCWTWPLSMAAHYGAAICAPRRSNQVSSSSRWRPTISKALPGIQQTIISRGMPSTVIPASSIPVKIGQRLTLSLWSSDVLKGQTMSENDFSAAGDVPATLAELKEACPGREQ